MNLPNPDAVCGVVPDSGFLVLEYDRCMTDVVADTQVSQYIGLVSAAKKILVEELQNVTAAAQDTTRFGLYVQVD